MLSKISWNTYLLVCGVSAVIYYAIIIWVYYRKRLAHIFTVRKSSLNGSADQLTTPDISLIEQYRQAERVKKDMQELFASLQEATVTKATLLRMNKERVHGLSAITDQSLRNSINNILVDQSSRRFNIIFTADEMDSFWQQAS